MTKITRDLKIDEVAALIWEALNRAGIDAFLSGGSVVTIYSNNAYQSFDLDFISLSAFKKIEPVMYSLGFKRDRSKFFTHPDSEFFVEFPGSAVLVGDAPIREFKTLKTKTGTLKILTPTDCVKDRLASFYHWNDAEGLNQALAVALAQKIDLKDIESWSKRENKLAEFSIFREKLKNKS